MTGGRRLVCALVSTAAAIACSTSPPPAARTEPSLHAIALPDLSSAAESAQTQVRQRYAALQQTLSRADASPVERATAYGEMGTLFVATEFYDAAAACFENARVLSPMDMKWPYYLGHVYRLKNEPAKAISAFEQAVALQPDHVAALVWLAEVHLSANEIDAAEQALLRAQTVDPKSGAVLFRLGRVALAKQDYRRAAALLEDALRVSPSATRIEYPLAMAYRGLGETRAAETHLKRRGDVDLLPDDPLMAAVENLLQNAAAYETRGSQAIEARQWPEAVASLSKAIQLAPANAFTRLNLGTALYMNGDSAGALAQYQEAVRLSPDLARAHFGIGVVMESRRQDAAAIEAFAAAVGRDPAYVEARFSLANALRRNGRVEESLTHYAEVLRTNPAVSQASLGYAIGLVRLGRYQEARDRLQQAMQSFPDQPGFAHALARLLAAAPDDRVRDGERAQTIMTGLVKMQRSAATVETMAMALAERGRFDDAVTWQREAIALADKGAAADVGTRLRANLRRYENHQPCRVPWTDDDPVHHPVPTS